MTPDKVYLVIWRHSHSSAAYSICLSAYLYIYLPINLSIYLSIFLSISYTQFFCTLTPATSLSNNKNRKYTESIQLNHSRLPHLGSLTQHVVYLSVTLVTKKKSLITLNSGRRRRGTGSRGRRFSTR